MSRSVQAKNQAERHPPSTFHQPIMCESVTDSIFTEADSIFTVHTVCINTSKIK